MPVKRFDIIIIGSGPAGTSAAEAAHETGVASIAVVESAERLGGECPNWGCMPTKSLLSSVENLLAAEHGREFGVRIPKVGVDFGSMMRRERNIVDSITGGGRIEQYLKGLGVELIRGPARFIGRDEIEVRGLRYSARRFVIATGSETVVPPVEGLKESGYLTVINALQLARPPRSLVIIGGGPVGIEFAQIFAPLGTEVTVVEYADHILSHEDEEIADVVAASFKKQGIALLASTAVVSVKKNGGQREVRVKPVKGRRVRKLLAEQVMVATGKKPSLAQLDLDKAGIQLDERGRLVLNEFLQTTNPAVYAAGDAAGRMMYTAVAHREGFAAAKNALLGNKLQVDLSILPRGTFCHPEVGSVGLTEKEARAAGYDVAVGRSPYKALSRPLAAGDMQGLVKIVADRKTGKIIGGHIVGGAAAELVHEIALAMYAGLTYGELANMIHAFPTFAEGVAAAAADVH